jgi:hypothetical protein
MKTTGVGLVVCLNLGIDPPDIVKPVPCARVECWIGVFGVYFSLFGFMWGSLTSFNFFFSSRPGKKSPAKIAGVDCEKFAGSV